MVEVRPGLDYIPHPDHRNHTPAKSQWLISESEETDCFGLAADAGWLLGDIGWGLHLPAGRPVYLGLATDHVRQVFVAKFVTARAQNPWHGYPADHQIHSQDIPDELVLREWVDRQLLSPAKARKIIRGQRCTP